MHICGYPGPPPLTASGVAIPEDEWFDNPFPFSPATVVLEDWQDHDLWIASEVRWQQEGDIEFLVLKAFQDEKWFALHDLHQPALNRWRGHLRSGTGVGTSVIVRPTIETDAIRSVTMGGMACHVPLPVSVLRYLHDSPGVFEQPQLLAVVHSDTTVSDVVLWCDDVGMFVRDSGAWHELHDCVVTAELRLETISAAGLDVFDRAAESDTRPRLNALGWVAP